MGHSAGRYQVKRFRKGQCPIVERLTSSLMMHGRNNGKKIMTGRIVKHSFEIIYLLGCSVGCGGYLGVSTEESTTHCIQLPPWTV